MSDECVRLTLDGETLLHAPLAFSAARVASVSACGISVATPIAALQVAIEREGSVLASVSLCDSGDEWVKLPGTSNGRCSLSIDVDAYTICVDATAFDAASAVGGSLVLRAVRVLRHASPAADVPVGAASESVGAAEGTDGDDDCVDAGDFGSLPALARAAHGASLRSSDRPGPPARCFTGVLEAAALAGLREDALAFVRRHGCGGRTYWIGASCQPRCRLERCALDILAFHVASGGGSFVGAEWWIQLRSVPPSDARAQAPPSDDKEAADRASGDDASSIAFHFDCDEGLMSTTSELVPPWISTVTYLSSVGAPTLVLGATPDAAGAAVPCAGVGLYVSFPHAGKHLQFDGRLLHGCPHALVHELQAPGGGKQPPTAETLGTAGAAASAQLRITLLVNLWRDHKPCGPQPLPARIAAALAAPSHPTASDPPTSDAPPPPEQFCARPERAAMGSVLSVGLDSGTPHDLPPATRRFAPTAQRQQLSPAAQTVHVRGFPCLAAIAAADVEEARAGLLHAPGACVVPTGAVAACEEQQ